MSRRKISAERWPDTRNGGRNLYESFLKGPLSNLFSQFTKEDASGASYKLNDCYVMDNQVEENLYEIVRTPIDKSYFIVGYTGTGKTTAIKHFFDIEFNELYFAKIYDETSIENARKKKKEKDALIMTEHCVILYISLEAAITEYEGKYSILSFRTLNDEFAKKTGEPEPEKLYDFIKSYKPNLVSPYTAKKTKKNCIDELKKDASQNDGTFEAYHNCLFQYNLANSKIKKVVFIIDGIEAKKLENVIEIICKHYNIYKSLQEYNKKEYYTKLIICCREYRMRELANDRDFFNSQLETYNPQRFYKKQSVSIPEIFKKRFEYLINDYIKAKKIKKAENYRQIVNKFVDVFTKISESVYSKSGDDDVAKLSYIGFAKLHRYDVRKQIGTLKKVATNSAHMYKDDNIDDSQLPELHLDKKDNIMRALAYGESLIYPNHSHMTESDLQEQLFPNIFHNDSYSDDYDLLCPYIVKYFLKQKQRSDNNNNGSSYGQNIGISVKKVKELFSVFFNSKEINPKNKEKVAEKIAETVFYLADCRILLRSVNSINDRLNHDTIHYLSDKGETLWDLLSEDNIYFEFMREDIFYEYGDDYFNNFMPNYKYSKSGYKNLFILCLDMLKHYFEKEILLIQKIAPDFEWLIRNFGKDLLVEHVLKGLKRTVSRYYAQATDKSDRNLINKEIKDFENSILARLEAELKDFLDIRKHCSET